MKYLSLRNRWVGYLGCVVLGAALWAGVDSGISLWRQAELRQAVEGKWILTSQHTDPKVSQVACEYRPDGTFAVWQTSIDGSSKIVEHGTWWISGQRLLQNYASLDGRPVPPGAQHRPEAKHVVVAGPSMSLVWPAGFALSLRRDES